MRDRMTDEAVERLMMRLDHEEAIEENRIRKPSKCSSTQGEYRHPDHWQAMLDEGERLQANYDKAHEPDAYDEGEVLSEPLGLKCSDPWCSPGDGCGKACSKPPRLTDTGQPPLRWRYEPGVGSVPIKLKRKVKADCECPWCTWHRVDPNE